MWDLAGFCSLFVYQIKHIIAPGYAMHCHVLPVGTFTEKIFRKEVIKKKLKIKIHSSLIKSSFSYEN